MSLEKQRIFWALLFFVIILSSFIVPFTPLYSNLAKPYGAFLFWNLFAIVVIIFLGIITARWRDEDER
jgi:membrane protein YdbS with pleckstrin-like domain